MAESGASRADDSYGPRMGPWNPQGEDLIYNAGKNEEEPMRINPMDHTADGMMMGNGPMGQGFGGVAIPPPEWANTMTVMMRNLPNKYTQRMLLAEINHTGFLGTFDFLYLPIDPETNANRGYAFLNFVDSGFAWMFKMSYEGRKMNRFNSNKVVSVTPATLQGFEANYAHYANARVNRGDPAARPLFLREPKALNGNFTDLACGGNPKKMGKQRKDRPGGADAGVNRAAALALAGQDDGMWPPSADILMSYYGGSGDRAEPMPGQGAGGMMPNMFPQAEGSFADQVGGGSAPDAGNKGTQGTHMTPKFCPHCGGPIQPMFQFCPHCGGNLDFGGTDTYRATSG
mmetsp:Transcript_47877/g.113776  ORF Transcript_47877/g.113776 Transcript_47877/m.113776 type:complete len:344 (-) Transcript_47877:80-1111(-)|eukprot:CAMPEP_0178438248 /NCGR_PEP_ID=MMETSP0689_2-20121128/35487_1 /TAXON_ID=160604 /ORGANISM="Amphidinium massartii, Strain CS-259" /LENGTH=343 /DNA_ID=CAMNT_0020060629 /DNA_START=111 /DNA_END=1142 /DNA_ORIENTATION=+